MNVSKSTGKFLYKRNQQFIAWLEYLLKFSDGMHALNIAKVKSTIESLEKENAEIMEQL